MPDMARRRKRDRRCRTTTHHARSGAPTIYGSTMARVTVVHTRRGTLLTKHVHLTWREFQDQYEDFMTSLGPYGIDDLFDYLGDEYPHSPPFAREDVADFLSDSSRSEFWSPTDSADSYGRSGGPCCAGDAVASLSQCWEEAAGTTGA
jgi:hypothetical protein